MNILVPGDLEKAKLKYLVVRTFACHVCGCKFEADNNEYQIEVSRAPVPHDEFFAECPCCKNRVHYLEPEET